MVERYSWVGYSKAIYGMIVRLDYMCSFICMTWVRLERIKELDTCIMCSECVFEYLCWYVCLYETDCCVKILSRLFKLIFL